MLISIITPVYNSEKTIGANVNSIVSQTYKNFEHIIVDNLSKDNTIGIIKKIYEENNISEKLKIISEPDTGISNAFNKGIKTAKGDIIAILNSDDEYFHNEVFKEVIDAFKDEKTKIVHGNIYFHDPVYGSNIRFPLYYGISNGIQFNHPAMFFHRSVYDELALYNESYFVSMDFEYYCRLVKNYKNLKEISYYLKDKPLVKMNAGGESWNNEFKSIAEIKSALKEYNLWNFESRKFYYGRKFRTILKKYLSKLNMNKAVKFWRKKKWGN